MVIGPSFTSRRALALLAIVVAALTLLRPICQLSHGHGMAADEVHVAWLLDAVSPADAGAPAARCCDATDSGAAMSMQAVLGSASPETPPIPSTLVLALVAIAFVVRVVAWRRPLPRTPQSFYLRSARIRR